MPLKIIYHEITKVQADAIVNPVNTSLLDNEGINGAIHYAAGSALLGECRALGDCKVGAAKLTKAYQLPAKYVIHTLAPLWDDNNQNTEKLIADCYKNSLALAKESQLESIAFPLTFGSLGYPHYQALKIAISVIEDFLFENEMTVWLVVYNKAGFFLPEKFLSITRYLDENYQKDEAEFDEPFFTRRRSIKKFYGHLDDSDLLSEKYEEMPAYLRTESRNLEEIIGQIDETFSQRLLRLIDEKGMTDTETYKRANIDRKLFSKIRNNPNYQPSKTTAIAFAIALRLNLDETKDLLLKAGFALSNSSKFDLIIQYFIEHANYNIFEINQALFTFEQNLLGS